MKKILEKVVGGKKTDLFITDEKETNFRRHFQGHHSLLVNTDLIKSELF